MNHLKILEKEYDGESLYDLERDVSEALIAEYNPVIMDIPQDEYGIQYGTFKVTIEWSNNE